MTLLAHVGHWAINLLYVAPLVVAVGVLGWQARKDRKRGAGAPPVARRPPSEPPPV